MKYKARCAIKIHTTVKWKGTTNPYKGTMEKEDYQDLEHREHQTGDSGQGEQATHPKEEKK